MQFDGRFLMQCQDTRIDFNELFHEIFTKIDETCTQIYGEIFKFALVYL